MSCDVGKAKRRKGWRMSCDVGEMAKVGKWALLILQTFRHFTYVTTHSPNPSVSLLRHSSFSNPSVASTTPQFILQLALLILQPFRHFTYFTTFSKPFRRFSYVTAHSPTLPLLHSSFSNPSFASPTSQAHELCSFSNLSITSPTSQFILQTLPSLFLRHSSFSNLSVSSTMPQFTLQPFFCFSYVTSSSLNSPGEPPMVFLFVGQLFNSGLRWWNIS